MRLIPNYITIIRILLTLSLILIKPLSITFLAIYITCGISDVLDGYIARKTNTTSNLGDKLDSIADMMLVFILIFKLYPVINPSAKIIAWIIIIAIIKAVSMIIVYLKYKTFEILHTYGNKFTGILLFLFPLLIAFIKANVLITVICSAATIFSIEELIIHLTSKKLQTNKKSLFL